MRYAGISATATVNLLTVKDNQPVLKHNIADAFGDYFRLGPAPLLRRPPPDLMKGRGRVEVRAIAVSSEVVPHLGWPGAAQAVRIARHRRGKGHDSVEIATLITPSLPPEEAGPLRLLERNPAHWAIENKLHHVRELSMKEERCRVRAGARPLATHRNLVTSVIRRRGLSIPEARENFREGRANAIKAVTAQVL